MIRLQATEAQRDDAREAHATLVAAYKDLQAYTDALQYHLISNGAHHGPNHQVLYAESPGEQGQLMAASEVRACGLNTECLPCARVRRCA